MDIDAKEPKQDAEQTLVRTGPTDALQTEDWGQRVRECKNSGQTAARFKRRNWQIPMKSCDQVKSRHVKTNEGRAMACSWNCSERPIMSSVLRLWAICTPLGSFQSRNRTTRQNRGDAADRFTQTTNKNPNRTSSKNHEILTTVRPTTTSGWPN
jgi:hypothetical protein